MTSVSLRNSSPATVTADVVVIGLHEQNGKAVVAAGSVEFGKAFGAPFAATLRALGASANVGDTTKLPAPADCKAALVLTVGLGPASKRSLESLRKAAGATARALAGKKTVAFAIARSDDEIRAVAEGALLGGYSYDRYLAKKAESISTVLVLTDSARQRSATTAADEATTIASAVNFARDLVNEPPNALYPETFVDAVRARARQTKVSVSVLDDKALTNKGYGGIVGVGQGSARPPRLATLTYRPAGAKAHIALVGKGITFDSGGLSIKPSNGMITMKCDMAGAASVAAAVFAIEALKLPIRVTAYACLAENMPSGHATRPGDVLTMYGGKTVEVLNTDAEGRLVLADGITTASERKPDLIIDVATLTGACVVALGKHVSGVMSNDDALLHEIPDVADDAGEAMWPLPIPDDMLEKVKATKVADLSQHNVEGVGGALFAAAFLREFVGAGIPWAHLDIAGTAFNDGSPSGYTPKGGTGSSIRTLVALARKRAEAS